MRLLPIYRRKLIVAHSQVDDGTFEWASEYRWGLSNGHVVRGHRVGGKCEQVRLHRVVLGLEFGDSRFGHHKDENPLNNMVSNLEIISASEHDALHKSRLTLKQVREIREKYSLGGVFQKDLALEYAVSQTNISALVRGACWSQSQSVGGGLN